MGRLLARLNRILNDDMLLPVRRRHKGSALLARAWLIGDRRGDLVIGARLQVLEQHPRTRAIKRCKRLAALAQGDMRAREILRATVRELDADRIFLPERICLSL